MIFLVLSVSAIFLLTKPGWLREYEDGTFTPEDEPGVGFDLTASYGFAFHFCNSCTAHAFRRTAVIRYQDGTDDAHIYLEGHDEYRELMHRLSLDSSQHLAYAGTLIRILPCQS